MPDPDQPTNPGVNFSGLTNSHLTLGNLINQATAGGDIVGGDKITIQIIQQAAGQPLPAYNLPAQVETLRLALPHLDPGQQAITQAAVNRLEQTIAALPGYEQAYLERVKAKYTSAVFVELAASAYEQAPSTEPTDFDMDALAERLQGVETLAELHEWQVRDREIRRIRLNGLREGLDKYPCLILLGDPGSGKTTALNHLAHQLATAALQSFVSSPLPPRSPAPFLPLPLRLSEFGPGQSVEEFIMRCWQGSLAGNHWAAPELAANLAGYLAQGRLIGLFDALNEMPGDGFIGRAAALRDFIDRWQAKGNRFIVTCRVLDYGEQLQGLQRVEVQPFSDEQIQDFLQKVLHALWSQMWAALTEDAPAANRQSKIGNRKSEVVNPPVGTGRQSLLEMARNPYILTMMVDQFIKRRGQLSRNRAELLQSFTETLWQRAKKTCLAYWLDITLQQASLSVTAFEMQQRAGSGAAVATTLVKSVMPAQVQPDPRWPPLPAPPDRVLTLAAGANLIEMPVDRSTVRFYHQLLQEYFSARELLKRVKEDLTGFGNLSGLDLDKLWRWPWWLETNMPRWQRPKNNYDPLPPPPSTDWEETTILAAGLAPENDTHLVQALLAVNPVLAGRCLHEGQAKVDLATRQIVINVLLQTIEQPEVALRVRIAAGEVLGCLGDPRLGQFVLIPAGQFVMGGDGEYDGKPKRTLNLPYGYLAAQCPLTNTEFAGFIADGGYQERRWWTEAGWQQKEKDGWTQPAYWNDSRFNQPNQPVVGISWYEAVAYCRWKSEQLAVSSEQSILRDQLADLNRQSKIVNTLTGTRRKSKIVNRLPTEAEWKKAARGPDGRSFPWGNDFDPARVNMDLGEQVVKATTPVGIYSTGRSPYGLYDCAGNVWEWCATQGQGDNWQTAKLDPYPYRLKDEWVEVYLNGTNVRVLRGGSWWDFNKDDARCAYRYWSGPDYRDNDGGCRLVVSPIF